MNTATYAERIAEIETMLRRHDRDFWVERRPSASERQELQTARRIAERYPENRNARRLRDLLEDVYGVYGANH